jgi:hypothetical protein
MAEVKKDSKKDGEEDAVAAVPADARVMWFEEKVCGALKVKADKFKKMITVAEYVYFMF